VWSVFQLRAAQNFTIRVWLKIKNQSLVENFQSPTIDPDQLFNRDHDHGEIFSITVRLTFVNQDSLDPVLGKRVVVGSDLRQNTCFIQCEFGSNGDPFFRIGFMREIAWTPIWDFYYFSPYVHQI